jgi:hypothetical protein
MFSSTLDGASRISGVVDSSFPLLRFPRLRRRLLKLKPLLIFLVALRNPRGVFNGSPEPFGDLLLLSSSLLFHHIMVLISSQGYGTLYLFNMQRHHQCKCCFLFIVTSLNNTSKVIGIQYIRICTQLKRGRSTEAGVEASLLGSRKIGSRAISCESPYVIIATYIRPYNPAPPFHFSLAHCLV